MTTQTATLDQHLIAALRVAVPLVLHGSSGVPDQQLRGAISAGITKINIGTALNIAYTNALREHFGNTTEGVDPRKYLSRARESVAHTVTALTTLLASPR